MSLDEKLAELRARGDQPNLPLPPQWNPQFQPRPYQRVGALHLLFRKHFVLGDPTGTGKTFQELLSWAMLTSQRTAPMLVLTTKSAVRQWTEEAQRFLLPGTPILEQQTWSAKRRLARWQEWVELSQEQSAILSVSWRTFVLDWPKLKDILPPTLNRTQVVLDECQKIKNVKSQTHRVVREMLRHADRVHGLTATLVKNMAHDAHAALLAIVPGMISTQLFEYRYCEFEWEMRPRKGGLRKTRILKGYKDLEDFKLRISPFYLGRTDRELGDERPEVQHIERRFPMNPEHAKLYRDGEAGIFTMLDGQETPDYGAAVSHAQILCSAPELSILYGEPDADVSCLSAKDNTKFEALEELLNTELFGEPVIVYSPFERVIAHYCRNLKQHRPVKITGKETDDDRNKARKAFMSGETQLLFISDAGGEGLNLQVSCNLIFLSRPWDCGRYVQIVGRVRRFGSEHSKVNIWHLTCQNSIDELVDAVVVDKFGPFEVIVQERGGLMPETVTLPLDVARETLRRRRREHLRNRESLD